VIASLDSDSISCRLAEGLSEILPDIYNRTTLE